jgi:hypothetical protein
MEGNNTTVDPTADNSTYDIDKRRRSAPVLSHYDDNDDGNYNETRQRRDTKPFYLRLMPLGASSTQGVNSADGNGYRKWLRSELRY